MAMKLNFDNPNRDYLIDSYLSALSDKIGDMDEKEQEVREVPELIERHALLKKVYEHPQERERMTDGEWCRKCIYEAPKVEAEPGCVNLWIPCSERMPEDRTGIIFTVDIGHPFVCVGYRINGEREGLKLQRWFDKLSGLNFIDYDVKAWMPMPDAYKPPEKE